MGSYRSSGEICKSAGIKGCPAPKRHQFPLRPTVDQWTLAFITPRHALNHIGPLAQNPAIPRQRLCPSPPALVELDKQKALAAERIAGVVPRGEVGEEQLAWAPAHPPVGRERPIKSHSRLPLCFFSAHLLLRLPVLQQFKQSLPVGRRRNLTCPIKKPSCVHVRVECFEFLWQLIG